MSKKHRTQIHVHPEPHPRRRGITTQDTNQRQTGRHPHKVCDSRSAEMAHLQHRHQHSLKPSYSRYHQYHQYVCNKHTSQHTDIRQIWLSHGRTQTSAAILNSLTHLVFFKKYQRTNYIIKYHLIVIHHVYALHLWISMWNHIVFFFCHQGICVVQTSVTSHQREHQFSACFVFDIIFWRRHLERCQTSI